MLAKGISNGIEPSLEFTERHAAPAVRLGNDLHRSLHSLYEKWRLSIDLKFSRKSGRGNARFESVVSSHSKSRSARSVGSIPTARTIQDSRLPYGHRTGGRSLHQRIGWGRTTHDPLREMTIERHCHVGTLQPRPGCSHRNKLTPRSVRLDLGSLRYLQRIFRTPHKELPTLVVPMPSPVCRCHRQRLL
jgi:hypothetical protein